MGLGSSIAQFQRLCLLPCQKLIRATWLPQCLPCQLAINSGFLLLWLWVHRIHPTAKVNHWVLRAPWFHHHMLRSAEALSSARGITGSGCAFAASLLELALPQRREPVVTSTACLHSPIALPTDERPIGPCCLQWLLLSEPCHTATGVAC